jgi:hypothetical protein
MRSIGGLVGKNPDDPILRLYLSLKLQRLLNGVVLSKELVSLDPIFFLAKLCLMHRIIAEI